MTTTLTTDTIFVVETLWTDTLVYEIVARTAKTITIRRTKDADTAPRSDTACDTGAHGLSVVWIEQVPDPTAATQIVRLRKDGTYRIGSSSPLRPAQGTPARRIDYRF